MKKKIKITNKDIKIINIERRNQKHPTTFEIHPREVRESVKTGDIVKLIFETHTLLYANGEWICGERMWVTIRECISGEYYIGTLNSYPDALPLKFGDWIRFGPEHILDIWVEDDQAD